MALTNCDACIIIKNSEIDQSSKYIQRTLPSQDTTDLVSCISHLFFVDYSPVSGAPGEQRHADPLGVRVLLVDTQPGQQVLAECLHEARAIATRQQVGVVVETVPHASKERK